MLWLQLVWSSFMAHLPWPMRPESMYYAILRFGGDVRWQTFLGGLFGNIIASALLIFIGTYLARLNRQKDEPAFLEVKKYVNLIGVWFLVIPGIALQPVLIFMAACAGAKPRRLALVVLIEHVIRYGVTAFVSETPQVITAFFQIVTY